MTFEDRLKIVNEKDLQILAIDIGNNGGFAWNGVDGDMEIVKTPKELDRIWSLMEFTKAEIIVAENVHAWAGQGVVSTGTLMYNKGIIEGMATALGVTVHWIEPLKWIECFTLKRKKSFKNKDGWKKHLMECAKKVLGKSSLVNEINLKTADAFLMWNYASSQHTNQPLRPPQLQFT